MVVLAGDTRVLDAATIATQTSLVTSSLHIECIKHTCMGKIIYIIYIYIYTSGGIHTYEHKLAIRTDCSDAKTEGVWFGSKGGCVYDPSNDEVLSSPSPAI